MSSYLPPRSRLILEPRKTPVQARSAASVRAILDATIQVLLSVGKERLTTTRVSLRAGVSVGTLYQYFPNKSSLLQAVLQRHLDEVTSAVERACKEQDGATLRQMATALVTAVFETKMRNAKTSVALYAVSSDVDGARMVQAMGIRSNQAIAEMLASSCEPLSGNPELVASLLQGALAGVSRTLLESAAPEQRFQALREESIFFASAYLEARSIRKHAVTAPAG